MPANLCPSKLADRHHDGIPDSIDPYPNDFFNNGPGYFFPALDSNGAATVVAYPMEADNHLVYFYSAPYYAAWADRDGDGIPDDADPHPDDYYNGTDTDGDGIPDSVEVAHGLNPYDASDASTIRYIAGQTDGLTWKQAYDHGCLDAFMDPNLDTDGDGMSDLYEIINGLDPNNPFDAVDAPVGYLNWWEPVTMNDFILNVEKARAGVPLSHIVTDPTEYYQITGQWWNGPPPHNYQLSVAENDWDGDGVSNGDEVLIFGTNPHDASSIPNDDALGAAYLAGRTSLTTSVNFLTIFSNVDSDHNDLADWVQVKYGLATNEANNIRYINGQTDGLTWSQAWHQHYLTSLMPCVCGGTTCSCAHAACCSSPCGGTLPNCSCGGDQCSCAPGTINACGSNSGPCFKCKCAGDKCACADSTVCVGKTDQCKSCTCGGKHCTCANKTVCGGDKTKCECECGGDKCACTTPNACGSNTDQCKPCACGGNACTCANATVCKGNSSGCQQAICSCTGAGCVCQTDMACRTNTDAHCLAPAVSITASSSSIAPNNNNDEGRPEPTGTEDPPLPFPKDNDNEVMLTSDPDIVTMVVMLDRANTSGGTLTLHVPVGYRVFNDSGSVLAKTPDSETDITLDSGQRVTTLNVEGLDNVSGGDFTAQFGGYTGGPGGGTIEDTTTPLAIECVTKGPNGEFIPQTVTWNSVAAPVVKVNAATAWITGGGTAVTVNVNGTVTDDTSDCTPTPGKQVDTLFIEGTSATSQVGLNNTAVYNPANLWRPYAYECPFNESVTVPVAGAGDYTVKLSTSINAGGLAGEQELLVHVDTASSAGQDLQLSFPSGYDATQVNALLLQIGQDLTTAETIVFTETDAGTRQFTGSASGSGFALTLVNFTGLTSSTDAVNVVLSAAGGSAGSYTLQLALAETGDETNAFVLDAAAPGNSKEVSVVLGSAQAPGTFYPTIVRVSGGANKFTGADALTVHVMDRDWNLEYNDNAGPGYWYVVDDNHRPVVFNPSLYAHTDIQTKKVAPADGFETFFFDQSGNFVGWVKLPVARGLVVMGDDISQTPIDVLSQTPELNQITGWKKTSKQVRLNGSEQTAYIYEPEGATANVGHNDRELVTEILWRCIRTVDTVTIFNSKAELKKDIDYRTMVCSLCKKADFKFDSPIIMNSDYWLAFGAVRPGKDPLEAYKNPFSSPQASQLYQMRCLEAAILIVQSAAIQIMPYAEFIARMKDGGVGQAYRRLPKPLRGQVDGFLARSIKPGGALYETQWLPGDFGYFANSGMQDDPVWCGENVFYIGGCFEENFRANARFYGHGLGEKTFTNMVNALRSHNTITQTVIINSYRDYLAQPFKQYNN